MWRRIGSVLVCLCFCFVLRCSIFSPLPSVLSSQIPLYTHGQVPIPWIPYLTDKSPGAIEQALTSHPHIAEAAVVGIPDALKGHLPFAFVTLSTHPHPTPAVPSEQLFSEVQKLVREQIGAIASLGGMLQGKGMIPKTRSGKTLRRVLRELVENATHGEFDKAVQVPSTIEDADVVDVARAKVKEYFREKGKDVHRAPEVRAKL